MHYSDEYGGWVTKEELNYYNEEWLTKEDYIRRECDRQDFEEMLQRQGMSEFADGTPLPPDDGINTIIEPI